MFIDVPQSLITLSKYFPENLFVVGGYVRNKLLGMPTGDIDLSSSVTIDEVITRLENSDFFVKVKNLKMGTLCITYGQEKFEYTFFRKDEYAGGAHFPMRVTRTDNIFDDAKRRDFTINAIYYNINEDKVVDFFGGLVDAKQKILRAVQNPDDVLSVDGERILRLVRLSGELNLSIDPKTLDSAKKFASNLEELSGSRKFVEIEKILYCDRRYDQKKGSLERALKLLNTLGVWNYLGLTCKKVKYNMVFKADDRLLGLLIDIVESENPECLQAFLEGFLKHQFAFIDSMTEKIYHYLAGYYSALSKMPNKQFFFKFFADWANIYPLLFKKNRRVCSKYNFFYQYIIEHGLVIQTTDLKVTEVDIKSAFPEIDKRNYGKILDKLLSKVFDGKIVNEKETLLTEIQKESENF